MTDFVHFRSDSGEIVGMGTAPEAYVAAQKQPGCGVLVVEGRGDYRASHYVVDPAGTPALAPKLDMAPTISATTVIADGTATITISGLPDPAHIAIAGPNQASGEVTGGEVALSFDAPGTYTVRAEAFPYLPWTVSIDAT